MLNSYDLSILSCPADPLYKIKIVSEIRLEARRYSLPAIASRSIRPEQFNPELTAKGLMAEGRRGGGPWSLRGVFKTAFGKP
jgi:hypothetical protein